MTVDQLGVEHDPRFSEEQREFAAALARYASERLKPNYARWDRYEPFPQEMISELGSLGVAGLRVPIEYGGTEAPYVTVGLAAEMLTRGDFNATYFVQLSAIAADILTLACGDVAKEWLPPLAAGEQTIALALTEPGAGSDAANISMPARPTIDGWNWPCTPSQARSPRYPSQVLPMPASPLRVPASSAIVSPTGSCRTRSNLLQSL